MKGFIPEKDYARIRRSVPIVCVDAIIMTPHGILLGVRNNAPAKGKVWFIGGRVHFGERMADAVLRKVREETGLRVRIEGFVEADSTIFPEREKFHTINFTYLVKQTGGRLRADSQHSRFVFVNSLDRRLHPYIRRLISNSGTLERKSTTRPRRTAIDFSVR